jgi:hypothetical protein
MHDLYLANQSHLINILTTFQLVYLCQAYVGPVSEGYGRQLSSQSEGHTINDGNILMTSSSAFCLPLTLKDKHGNEYELNQVSNYGNCCQLLYTYYSLTFGTVWLS